jgi:hypothetical protein
MLKKLFGFTILKYFVFIPLLYIFFFKIETRFEKRAERIDQFSEWKLNYEHGFIKRGLSNYLVKPIQLFFRDERLAIIILNVFIEICLILSLISIVPKRIGLPDLCLLLSPLLFLNLWRGNIWEGQFRKENIFLLLLVNLFTLIKIIPQRLLYIFLSGAMVVIILLHELHLFLVPVLFFIVYQKVGFRPKWGESLGILAVFALLFYILFIYDSHPVLMLQLQESKFSTEADKGYTWLYSQRQTELRYIYQGFVTNKNFLAYYVCFNLLGFFAIFLSRAFNPGVFSKMKPLLLLVPLCFIPLFAGAWDWGRWTSLMFSILVIFYYLESGKQEIVFSYKSGFAALACLGISLTTNMQPFWAIGQESFDLFRDSLVSDAVACGKHTLEYIANKWGALR